MTAHVLFYVATVLQGLAVFYALYLMGRGAGRAAWLWLIGSMLSMLAWRVVHMLVIVPPTYFNPLIAIWGSSCLFLSMFFFRREIARRERAEGERERAEAQRDALLESERAAREQAERANRLKDHFLAALSHELRTPLTAILGWCEILRSPPDRGGKPVARPDDAAAVRHDRGTDEALATIERSARAQAALIEDLLDVTRINAGMLRLEMRQLVLADAVRAAAQTVRPLAAAKGIEVELDLDESSRVAGDSMRLEQVVWNLLSNAVKFTPAGGQVSVRLARERDVIVLEVADTGEGIAPEFVPNLFTRFRQADGSTSRRHGGLGLGLSIVKSLVELHGGHVVAHSDGPGRGARFTVVLAATSKEGLPPDRRRDLPPADTRAEHAPKRLVLPAVTATSLAGMRILVVDDDPDVRGVIQRVLERHGASVRAVGAADEAISTIAEFAPDVLVSDIGMPREDGYTFIKRLRGLGARSGGNVPAVALTAYAREVDRGQAISSGFQAHVVKPVDAAELVATILRVSESSGASARGRHDGSAPISPTA